MGCGYGNPDVFGVIPCRQSCFAAAGCRLPTVRTGSRIRGNAGWRVFPEEGRVRYFCGALAEGGPALGCPLGALNRWGGRPVGDVFLRGGSGRGALQEGGFERRERKLRRRGCCPDIDKNPFGRCRTSAVLSGEVGGVSGRRSPESIARPMSRSGRTGRKIMKAGRCLVRLESYLSDRASCRRYRAMNERSRPCGMRPCLRLAGRIREGGGAVCSAFPDEIETGDRMFEPFAARDTVFG